MANRVRETLTKLDAVASAIVDTTDRAVIRPKQKTQLSKGAIEAALKSIGSSVKTFEMVKRPRPAAVYEITVDGLG